MLSRLSSLVFPLFTLFFLAFGACTKSNPPPPMEVGLYSGIAEVARLGESESLISSRKNFSISRSAPSADFEKIGITSILSFPDLGVRTYLRKQRVVLLEVQEPFKGWIQGKQLDLFPFRPNPDDKGWDERLIREFGTPTVRASGGRFSSEALFYSWGDISFNKMGPNQIAIYRDNDIAQYRIKNFGRQVELFNEN